MKNKPGRAETVIQRWIPISKRAHWIVLSLVGDRQIAEDAIQAALLDAIEKTKTLRDPAQFEPWFIRIASRTACMMLGESGRLLSLEDPGDTCAWDNSIRSKAMGKRTLKPAHDQLVRTVLQNLRPENRKYLFCLRYIQDHTIGEISAITGWREDTLTAVYHQMLCQISVLLAKEQAHGHTIDNELFLKLCAGQHRSELKRQLAPDTDVIAMTVHDRWRKRRKHRALVMIRRIGAAALFAALLMNAALFLNDTAPVKAYKHEVRKCFRSLFEPAAPVANPENANPAIDELQKKAPFRFPLPYWLPDGYRFASARLDGHLGGAHTVRLKYSSDAGSISVSISDADASRTDLQALAKANYKLMEADGATVALLQHPAAGNSICRFMTETGLYVSITAKLDEPSMLRLAMSMN